jgi:hypothetical protein
VTEERDYSKISNSSISIIEEHFPIAGDPDSPKNKTKSTHVYIGNRRNVKHINTLIIRMIRVLEEFLEDGPIL